MKLGVSSYSFRKYQKATGCDFVALADKAKELGFDGIEFLEIRGEDPIGEAKRIRDHCAELGLPIVAYTIGANLLSDNVEEEVARLKRSVEVAAALGAPVMRHDVSTKLRPIEGYTWEMGIDEMVPAIREITAYAAERGVRTCSENHGKLYQDSLRVKRLIEAVDDPNYGWLVDIGNFLCVDEEPLSAVRRAAPYAVHAHAKDFLYHVTHEGIPKPDGFFETRSGNLLRGTVVGHGMVPVFDCVKALKESGYDGWLSLEFEGAEENLPALTAGLSYLRRCIDAL